MRKWYRFRINTGNTGALAASYTGKSSLRASGSILWAPKLPLKKGAQWATKSNLRMCVVTLQINSVNKNNFKCVQRRKNKKVY